MLTVKELTKTIPINTPGVQDLHAVRKVSFNIKDGELVALIGESGSGKSTIGRMILRQVSTSAGEICYDGVNVATLKGRSLKEYCRKVQGVFQNPFSSYNPALKADQIFVTIREEFFPQVSDARWVDRLETALLAVGLDPEQVLNRFPRQLSAGQLQRFLLARALLLNSQLIVADEIISMAQGSTRSDVLNLLGDLKRRGLAVLLITQDLSLGCSISERSIILYRGCVVELGAANKVFERPMHPYTRSLLVSAPPLDPYETSGLYGRLPNSARGCAFYARCPIAAKDVQCMEQDPQLTEMEPGHFVACCKTDQLI